MHQTPTGKALPLISHDSRIYLNCLTLVTQEIWVTSTKYTTTSNQQPLHKPISVFINGPFFAATLKPVLLHWVVAFHLNC